MSGPERVLVAMSGGVDSSVAAALLREQGHTLVGVTLHLWDATGESKVGRCCAPEDRDDARRTCEALDIPHYVIDEREAFRTEVVDPFLDAYRGGTTPSPCVACNQYVKLGRLAQLADQLGCTKIATGHYARVELDPTGPVLLRGADASKDQSYFLYGVPSSILARLVLPLGGMTKDRTRDEGRRLGVPNWAKKDSQELCFVPDGDIGGFVEREAGAGTAGRIVDETGAVLAAHDGVQRFTIGQRKGLGLAGPAPDGKPRYVLRIVRETGDVIVGGEDGLRADALTARHVTWIGDAPREAFEAEVQIRHRHAASPARVEPTADGFVARFASPQRAVAPGQAAVVYVGPRVVGGGTIA
ncbi:tRNA 2-thiouridine(34) synthase MnmA [Sandaracinus amylolyticus]|uniref:tRNA 2-thiouridine(34) synthase MnmA n=1 Tax=Sandaracinus amylolyticus TaxID=927083 RepID=UPI001F0B3A3F|nr:tRNA 2-thiouridine(34) synthase MnmA [Sandaracinus amylolyticus]